MSVASTSQHLQVLRGAHLVGGRKEGLFVHYRLAHPDVFLAVRSIRTLASTQLAEVDRLVDSFIGDRKDLEAVTSEQLLARAKAGEVTVLDVRPAEEFRFGHIAGALSIPVAELEQRLGELPPRRDVVAYCRGPYCVYADEAVKVLRDRGWKARRLEDGYPEWRAAGLPVEVQSEERETG
jgi:rhodanese-related sulfurtransferase